MKGEANSDGALPPSKQLWKTCASGRTLEPECSLPPSGPSRAVPWQGFLRPNFYRPFCSSKVCHRQQGHSSSVKQNRLSKVNTACIPFCYTFSLKDENGDADIPKVKTTAMSLCSDSTTIAQEDQRPFCEPNFPSDSKVYIRIQSE